MTNKKTVLITGASSGIGESLLHKYVSEGYHVIACGRNQEKLSNLIADNVTTFAFDITVESQVKAVADLVDSIDILVLNAGDCQYIDDAKHFDGQLFSNIITTNLISLGYLLQNFLPKVQTKGQVVFVSSSAVLLPFPKAEAYGASKAGVDYLANSLRIDLIKDEISVTLVHPGFIKTPLTDKNDFSMPFLLTSEQAAIRIFDGVLKKKKYLHFPKRLTWTLKVFSFLPAIIWQTIILRNNN